MGATRRARAARVRADPRCGPGAQARPRTCEGATVQTRARSCAGAQGEQGAQGAQGTQGLRQEWVRCRRRNELSAPFRLRTSAGSEQGVR